MSNVPTELKYAKTHEWVRVNDDGSVTVGISAHAQDLLGDMVYVELPEVGRSVAAEDACAVVESVKAASDVYAPVAGEVLEANDALADSPELINQEPYGDGWIMRIRPTAAGDVEALLDAAAYTQLVADEH